MAADPRPIAIVLPPEFDGVKGFIDDVGGGHEFEAKSETPGAHAVAVVGLNIGADCPPSQSYSYTYLTLQKDGYRPYRRDGVPVFLGPVQIRVGVGEDTNRTAAGLRDTFLPAMAPNIQQTVRPLVGPVRIAHYPSSRTHSFVDDTGPRRVLFCSWFCALRDWKDRRSYAEGLLDVIADAGYQGIRIFRFLGESDESGYFAGRTVQPSWSIGMLLEFAGACRARGLRLTLTSGRQWSFSEWMAWERQCAAAVRDAGLSETITLWEGTNEYWQNAPGRDSDEQIAFYGELFAMVRTTLSPAPLCACGAPENEDPDKLYRAATHSDILEKHGERDEDRCVKRGFTIWYWEGDPGHFPKPIMEGEPKPFLGPDAFMPTDKPGRVVAVLAMNALWGAATTFFCGEAVKGTKPIEDAPGLRAVPSLLSALPEDVATWGHVPGGKIWWWQGPGKQFATVADSQWGYEATEPPLPIAHSTVIGPGWTTRNGGTRPFVANDEGGALIVGEFA